MSNTFLRLFLLMFFVACSLSSPQKENVRKQQSEIIYNTIKNDPANGELIKAYFDFYAYSLRRKCKDLKYESTYPGNELLQLPKLNYGSVSGSASADRSEIAAESFDLTDINEGQKYELFFMSNEIRQWEYSEGLVKPTGPENNIVLLRTGAPEDARYVICSDKLGSNLVCSYDKIITQLADVNDPESLCEAVRTRKIPMKRELFLRSIIELLVNLQLFHRTNVVSI